VWQGSHAFEDCLPARYRVSDPRDRQRSRRAGHHETGPPYVDVFVLNYIVDGDGVGTVRKSEPQQCARGTRRCSLLDVSQSQLEGLCEIPLEVGAACWFEQLAVIKVDLSALSCRRMLEFYPQLSLTPNIISECGKPADHDPFRRRREDPANFLHSLTR